jgi:calcium permeable stress-gated cation channel
MLVEDAPAPNQIYWPNIGLPPSSRRTGTIVSLAATATLCLFWSIPVAFISSLTEVNSLKETLPRLGDLMEQMPALELIFATMAPLLLLGLNEGILPTILKYFSTWEGHISSPRLEASLFKKLGAFAIIQTFFVSTVSGSITSELANMVDNPGEIVQFLGTSLPAQSSYFIQIVFVFTFFVQGLELLRVVPLSYALVRRYVGPRLTEKERSRSWHFVHSLEDPPPFHLADNFAQIVLFYVVFFVYSSTSPITCVFLFGCFLIVECGYRYHIIHNFKADADSGGRLFEGFVNFLMSSVVIGQVRVW